MTAPVTAPPMLEGQLQSCVVDLWRRLGGMSYHAHDSRKSAKGFPDLVLVHPRTGALIFVELKAANGRLMLEQRQWLDALRVGHRDVFLWRPEQWHDGTIPRVLTDRARRGRR